MDFEEWVYVITGCIFVALGWFAIFELIQQHGHLLSVINEVAGK